MEDTMKFILQTQSATLVSLMNFSELLYDI